MDAIRRFWRQPSTHYRNFQIVALLAALQFFVPAAACLAAPDLTLEQYALLNQWLGGEVSGATDALFEPFRLLAVANMAVLGFLCVWLQRDLRNRSGALAPFVALQLGGAAALGGGSIAGSGGPAMGAIALFDLVVCSIVVVFTVLARADIHRLSDAVLYPAPVGASELEWLGFEQRWVESILAATLPARPEDDMPGFSEVELDDFWERFLEWVPLHFRLGLRLSTWVVTFWPILTFRSIRTFHGLSEDRKDDVLRSIEHSDFFVIRQATFVLKTTAGFAYFRDPEHQQRFPGAYRKFSEHDTASAPDEPPELPPED